MPQDGVLAIQMSLTQNFVHFSNIAHVDARLDGIQLGYKIIMGQFVVADAGEQHA